jgi:arabinogalactan endo-1,4-beta-galactosidase
MPTDINVKNTSTKEVREYIIKLEIDHKDYGFEFKIFLNNRMENKGKYFYEEGESRKDLIHIIKRLVDVDKIIK